MKAIQLLTVTAGLSLLAGCQRLSSGSGSGLDYFTSGEVAFAQARQRSAPIFLNFGGPW